ncbi:single-stranded DNA-binding protein [Dactylosporangium sp. CA-139066]|uniref:single-stranded DNA-binding protein n=1 Tax=Dactylosporangium sp. CA-139066 TaxID=3239930 RepID=UPI003D939A55
MPMSRCAIWCLHRRTIVGNVLNAPDCRRIVDSQALVTHFKVASTSRRFDRTGERWIDGDSLRVRVNCWRQLAENVARSVQVGDPVIVTGRLYSRDWETEDHVRRVSYELDAHSVGHDLSRGRAKFARIRPHTATSAIDDELAEARIGEAPTTPADEINGLPRRRAYDEDLGGYVTVIEDDDPFAAEVLASLDSDAETADDPFERPEADLAAELSALTSPDPQPEPASDSEPEPEEDEDEVEPEDPSDAADEAGTRTEPDAPQRGRRRPRGRVPAAV